MKQKIARATKRTSKIPLLGKFIPVMKPLYATPEELMEKHGGSTYVETKHDGYRIQIHKTKSGFKMYTASGNEYNYGCYPDVVGIVNRLPEGIFEAELVGIGDNHKQVFDKVKQRFRREGLSDKSLEKYVNSGIIDDVPMELRLFDVFRFERKGLLYAPIEKRRKHVEMIAEKGIEPTDQVIVSDLADLERMIAGIKPSGKEGIVCKRPGSLYQQGKAHDDWVKFKRYETLDLVVVGLYKNGDESSDTPYVTALCATFNDEKGVYETLGKVGLSRKGTGKQIADMISAAKTGTRPRKVAFSDKLDNESYARHVPDVYVDPERSVVLEIRAMNLNYASNWQSCGRQDGRAYSMRIGFVEEIRHDKSPKMATKTSAIKKLYELQERGGAI